jgi:hypothetical protein
LSFGLPLLARLDEFDAEVDLYQHLSLQNRCSPSRTPPKIIVVPQ